MTATMIQENMKLLFRENIQFNPEKLQAGGGSGLGLFSKCNSCVDRSSIPVN